MVTIPLKMSEFLVLILLLFNACGREKEEYPISDAEIKNLLMDIHTSEAALQSVFGRRKDSLREVYMDYIYKIHRMDSLEVQDILGKLREDPEKIEGIYMQMLEEMTAIPD